MGKQNKIFRNRLKKLREQEQISKRRLSQLCGLSDSAIRRYEHGESMPTPESLAAIADHFGVSTDYLLGRENF